MRTSIVLLGMVAFAVTLLTFGCSRSEPPPATRGSSGTTAARPVPPYHESAQAAQPFPPLLPAEYFRRYPLVARAYRIASEIPEVIAQQPCYCYCNKFGHRSLLDCYASDHGAG